MQSCVKRRQGRHRRKLSIRKRISGTAAKPRMSVFRSSRHIYVQVINDIDGHTLASASSLEPALREQCASLPGKAAAELVGKMAAERCLAKDIKKIVFDRNGFIYHGRLKALADAARETGLQF
jgi:large subunit ribosomal protein L18